MSTPVRASTQDPGRLADLTRRYAPYSLSAGGLGSALGGTLVLITYFVGALAAPTGAGGRLALAAAPLVWIAAKELLRTRYYQRLGQVRQPWGRADRGWHVAFTLFTAAASVGIVVSVIRSAGGDPAVLLEPAILGYLAFVVALPPLVWFFMRTPLEFIAGVFLVAQAAVILAGGHYELGRQPQAPIAAVVLIALGIRQHLQFKHLQRELAELSGAR